MVPATPIISIVAGGGVFAFLLGAVVASFVGVVAARLHTGESIARGRSRCDVCGETLDPFSLVPIVAFVVGRGHSRCCDTRISSLAPVSEAVLGVLFAYAYLTVGISVHLLLLWTALALLLLLVLYDIAHSILPPVPLWLFVAVSLLISLTVSGSLSEWVGTFDTALLLALLLGSIHVFSRGRAMGFADIPLVFALGLLTGPVALSGFIFSFWIGAIVGLFILARRPRGSRMMVEVPFAPFLAAGFLLAYCTSWNPFTLIEAILS